MQHASSINIAEFRRTMGTYLDRVRHGEALILADRDRPFARIVPLTSSDSVFAIVPPKQGHAGVANLKPLSLAHTLTNSLDLLREDREQR